MSARFSIVYPTRHRPEFVRQALRILETQRHDSFDVVICDNYLDPALSCEEICRDSSLANLIYVRPPRPVGMVENWNHALQFATGDYICYLTDKMFVLPDALGRIERAIDAARGPEIVSWTSDAYNPESYADYFGDGLYFVLSSGGRPDRYRSFSPVRALDRRGRGEVSRGEQNSSDYSRGKLAFGAYRRELVQRIVKRSGALFHNINPDYTSMVLGLAEARSAIELTASCVVSVNTDISNGMLCDTDDAAALRFLNSLAGGAESIMPKLLVPGLYVSVHNWVAHDYLALRTDFDLSFAFNVVNWLVYCHEDVYRPSRHWSDARVEAEQKGLLDAYLASLNPPVADAVQVQVRARAARVPPTPKRPPLRRQLPRRWQRPEPMRSPSIQAAVESLAPDRNWAGARRS
jgi:glycosyltransferase involved in cell wall biosynthesis